MYSTDDGIAKLWVMYEARGTEKFNLNYKARGGFN